MPMNILTTCVKKSPKFITTVHIAEVLGWKEAERRLAESYRKDVDMSNVDKLGDLEKEVKVRRSIKTSSWDNLHVPEESLPKNINHKYRCTICDRKIPRDNPFCYKCRKEYSISREGIFKYNIPKFENERLESKEKIYQEDKSFPIRCTLCRKNRVRKDGGVCFRCLKYILEEEE